MKLYRWRILERVRQDNKRLLAEIGGLENMDPEQFYSGLSRLREMWSEHDLRQRSLLYGPAGRRTRRGRYVSIPLEAYHDAVSQTLENLAQKLDGSVHTAARDELQAMRVELARHMKRDERQVLRPLMRALSPADRRELARHLAPDAE